MNKKNVFTAVSVIIGALVGAGFISGREIAAFFLQGNFIVAAIAFAVIFFGGLYFLLSSDFFYRSAFDKYSSFLSFFANLFMIGGLLSAADDVSARLFGVRALPVASVIIMVFSFFVQRRGVKSLSGISRFLTPAVIAFTLVLIVTSNSFSPPEVNGTGKVTSVFSYVGLNLFVSIPIFKQARENLNKKESLTASIIVTLILLSLILLTCVFIGNDEKTVKDSLPMLVKLSGNPFSKILFSIIILSGIVTAVISEHFSVESFIKTIAGKNGKQGKIPLLAAPIVAIIISKLGFYNIVAYVYPIIGFIGGITIFLSAIFRLVFQVRRRRDTLMPQARTK